MAAGSADRQGMGERGNELAQGPPAFAGTHLVVFAKTPELGRVKTRLQPRLAPEDALRLHVAFVHDTLELARDAGAARVVVAFSGDPQLELVPPGIAVDRQAGADLGERLQDATRRAFAAGAARLVVIGTDSPDLPAQRIDAAFRRLETSDLVLGPAADGGYYLIGLNGPHLGVYDAIDWGSERVLDQTRSRASALGLRVSELEPWFDVDRPEDLQRLADEIRRRSKARTAYPRSTAEVLDLLGFCVVET